MNHFKRQAYTTVNFL